jgi:hypothetical protein
VDPIRTEDLTAKRKKLLLTLKYYYHEIEFFFHNSFSFFFSLFATSCEKDDDITIEEPPETTIDTLLTADGIEFVRTPESNFDNLPDWPYAYQYVEIDGLRQAYAEAGPADGEVVLLLHGQPSWSYLYRKMIPVLAMPDTV